MNLLILILKPEIGINIELADFAVSMLSYLSHHV